MEFYLNIKQNTKASKLQSHFIVVTLHTCFKLRAALIHLSQCFKTNERIPNLFYYSIKQLSEMNLKLENFFATVPEEKKVKNK